MKYFDIQINSPANSKSGVQGIKIGTPGRYKTKFPNKKIMMPNYDDISRVPSKTRRLPSKKSPETVREGKLFSRTKDEKPFVLIFGIEKDIRFLLRTILEMWGYEVEEAESVEESIVKAGKKSFDMVLMDTEFSFSNSFSEMRRMQKFDALKDLPFVIFSGHAQEDVRIMALAAGATEFFVKPINLDLLEETIKMRFANAEQLDQSGRFR